MQHFIFDHIDPPQRRATVIPAHHIVLIREHDCYRDIPGGGGAVDWNTFDTTKLRNLVNERIQQEITAGGTTIMAYVDIEGFDQEAGPDDPMPPRQRYNLGDPRGFNDTVTACGIVEHAVSEFREANPDLTFLTGIYAYDTYPNGRNDGAGLALEPEVFEDIDVISPPFWRYHDPDGTRRSTAWQVEKMLDSVQHYRFAEKLVMPVLGLVEIGPGRTDYTRDLDIAAHWEAIAAAGVDGTILWVGNSAQPRTTSKINQLIATLGLPADRGEWTDAHVRQLVNGAEMEGPVSPSEVQGNFWREVERIFGVSA